MYQNRHFARCFAIVSGYIFVYFLAGCLIRSYLPSLPGPLHQEGCPPQPSECIAPPGGGRLAWSEGAFASLLLQKRCPPLPSEGECSSPPRITGKEGVPLTGKKTPDSSGKMAPTFSVPSRFLAEQAHGVLAGYLFHVLFLRLSRWQSVLAGNTKDEVTMPPSFASAS